MKKLYPMGLIALIFLFGIAFILYPSIGNLVTLSTASISIADYEEKVEEMKDTGAQERLEEARTFNQHLFYGVNEEDEDKCLNMDSGGLIGYLEIPVISVYLPVYYGTSDEVLSKGVGYIVNSSLPVGGVNTHSVLSGHTGLPGAELLSSLDKMKEGDMFFIHVLGETLAYEVDEISVVKPDETEGLKIFPGKDYVTLVTCTPYGVNSDRLLVRGKRTDYVPEEMKEQASGNGTVKAGLSSVIKRQILVIVVIVSAAVIVAVSAEIYRRRSLKKPDEK